MKLGKEFYINGEVTDLAKELLGKYLYVNNSVLTAGKIVETEAYSYKEKACHAYNNRFTKRTSIMFEEGGVAYVYTCYGIHSLFNIVTNKKGIAEAVLIRAIEPMVGQEVMKHRRGGNSDIASGPGKLTQALGISKKHNGTFLTEKEIWIESGIKVDDELIGRSKRIGVDYAEEDAKLEWRFFVKNSPFVSH
ncbi:MAG: DNA-3-methyladenine glycosylase [Cyclobacteriaceae bacterium]|nr:DNA-3-methyladenine glycosylase [Cyclobacteriaceae bacterium]